MLVQGFEEPLSHEDIVMIARELVDGGRGVGKGVYEGIGTVAGYNRVVRSAQNGDRARDLRGIGSRFPSIEREQPG